MNDLEHKEQVALIQWFDLQIKDHKIFAIPNGGDRNIVVAKKLKAEGVRAGVPDLFLPTAKGIFHGLFIEMKAGKNKVTEKQSEWIDYLNSRGFKAMACYSWLEAKQEIETYLGLWE